MVSLPNQLVTARRHAMTRTAYAGEWSSEARLAYRFCRSNVKRFALDDRLADRNIVVSDRFRGRGQRAAAGQHQRFPPRDWRVRQEYSPPIGLVPTEITAHPILSPDHPKLAVVRMVAAVSSLANWASGRTEVGDIAGESSTRQL
jgi:hypothetical protein